MFPDGLARSDLQSERFKNHCSFGDSEDRLQSEDGLQIRPSDPSENPSK